MYSNKPIQFHKNRSAEPDRIIKWLDIASILIWFMFIFSTTFISYAKPGDENFFDRLFKVTVRDYWDFRILGTALIFSVILFIISALSIYLNKKRLKRKYDRIRFSFYISGFLSLLISIVLLIIII